MKCALRVTPSVVVVDFENGMHCVMKIDDKCRPHGAERLFSALRVKVADRAWLHGVQHGTATHYFDNGLKFRMEMWYNGVLEGSQITYAPIRDSPPLIIRKYKAGVRHGPELWYFAGTSNLYAAVQWKNGVRQGLATVYWPDQTSRAKVWYAKGNACLVVMCLDKTALDELDSLM